MPNTEVNGQPLANAVNAFNSKAQAREAKLINNIIVRVSNSIRKNGEAVVSLKQISKLDKNAKWRMPSTSYANRHSGKEYYTPNLRSNFNKTVEKLVEEAENRGLVVEYAWKYKKRKGDYVGVGFKFSIAK